MDRGKNPSIKDILMQTVGGELLSKENLIYNLAKNNHTSR